MKKPLTLLLALAITGIVCLFYYPVKKSISVKPATFLPQKFNSGTEEEDGMEQAMQQEFEQTKDPRLNKIPVERLMNAAKIRNQRLAQLSSARIETAISGLNWQERGPNNMGGRTRALLFDLGDAANGYKKVWAGGVGGGLWYTNDITGAQPIWNKVNDFFENIAITAIVQNPNNTLEIYAATGEGWFNTDAIKGLGIWKTTNGGTTWNRLAPTAVFDYVNDLLIDKKGNLYASVRQEAATDAAGIQKSTDGGQSWTQVLGTPLFGSSARGADLELAANGDIYATLGTTASNGGIYLSDFAINKDTTGNAGAWLNITPNSSGIISTPDNFWSRIELACAPSDANVVYALFQGYGDEDCAAIQQYNKATNSWSVKTVPNTNSQGAPTNFSGGQAWYDLIAAVDPNNANTLYIGGLDALRSVDGGTTWVQMTAWSLAGITGFTNAQYVHADHHVIAYAPGSSARAIWGTDGGIYYTANANISGGKPSFADKNNGFNVTQYYSCAAHPTNTNYFLAGAQDNGTHQFTASGVNRVSMVTGGDGALCHIDQDNPNIQITSFVYNNYFVSTDGGNTFLYRSFGDATGNFVNPTDYDKAGKKLYAGNTTGTYLRWEDPATGGSTANPVTVAAFNSAKITHVAVSPLTANRVYFGLNNGSIVRVDGTNSGNSKTGTILKTGIGSVSCIAIDPADENHMLVTYYNYGVSHVFESVNANSTSPVWTNVQNLLPDMPVRWAMFDPRSSKAALLATELGVWSTDNLNGTATDWQPTNTGLANVRVDMLKYRSSDRTLVAATHGRGLFTATISNVTTADINFTTGTTSLIEQKSGTIDCRSYKDYSVPLTISNAPVGNATVTISVLSGATAVQGIDYDYTTNNDFASPSHTLTFANGATDSLYISVRIYDDAEVNKDRSFTLTYTLSGSTTAKTGSSYQQETIYITDNDTPPAAPATATYTIGDAVYYLGDATSGSPFDAKVQSKKTQMLYTASELKAAGLSKGTIRSIAFYITKNSTRPYLNLQIKMGLSSVTHLVDGTSANIVTTTPVKSIASFSPPAGTAWSNIPLDNPFYWDGVSSLVIETCYDNGTADAANFADQTIGYSDGSASNQGNTIWQDNIACGTSFTSVTYINNGIKPIVQFNHTSTGTIAATALNSTITERLAANKDLYYYTTSGDLIAKVTNLSNFDYGCTQVIIDRAGTGAAPFWNNNPANYVMEKTFHVIPATNNTSGKYQITFYFSKAEKEGWEAATGQSWNNIQLIKVPSQINKYAPNTPFPDGSDAVQIVTPVLGTVGNNYTLSYTFTTGFSGFGAGVPGTALPVTLLDFNGQQQKSSILLNWTTSTEYNSKQFEVQKSTDGTAYTNIGIVKAAGNSTATSVYHFSDNRISEKNYYRLKMVDKDDKSVFGTIILIKTENAAQQMWVLTNPFTDYIAIRLAKKPQKLMVYIISQNGQIILQKEMTNSLDNIQLDVSGKMLAKGVYIVKVIADGEAYSSKVVKQ